MLKLCYEFHIIVRESGRVLFIMVLFVPFNDTPLISLDNAQACLILISTFYLFKSDEEEMPLEAKMRMRNMGK